jgi:epoxyqueuosine reductase
MKEEIRRHALALGFDDCRFAPADRPAHADALMDWIAEGRHGELGWIQRNADKRMNPDAVVPGARSIICVSASYHLPIEPTAGTATGRVARYARHRDYHDVLAEPLTQLCDRVNSLLGEPPGSKASLWYVDTGPILERDHAQRAGLGFVGKHTNLISRSTGKWMFLAEIITRLEIEPDPPARNHCGKCTRCLDACPTGAITGPYRLDARRCISYLTIELKGSIPEALRPAIGDRIYGCDDCLEACPWNRFAKTGGLMRQHHRSDLQQPELLELLALDETAFRQRFRGTPLFRTKRRGVLRNVCVALGNVGDRTALPALERAQLDEEPLIAEHARWAIGRILERGSKHDCPPTPHD